MSCSDRYGTGRIQPWNVAFPINGESTLPVPTREVLHLDCNPSPSILFIMLHKLPSAGIVLKLPGHLVVEANSWMWNALKLLQTGKSFLLCFSTYSNSQLTSEATSLLNSAKTVFIVRHFWVMLKISYCTLWWVNLGWLLRAPQVTPSFLSSLAIQEKKIWWKAYGSRKGPENHSPITTTGRLNLFVPINNRVG